jgi:hypothetical protein
VTCLKVPGGCRELVLVGRRHVASGLELRGRVGMVGTAGE